MRTIDELGISQTPWAVNNVGNVRDNIADTVAKMVNVYKNETMVKADACLIAAAPELYRALREAVIEMCHDCHSCEGSENGYRCEDPAGRCFVQKWREVLARASGEEVK